MYVRNRPTAASGDRRLSGPPNAAISLYLPLVSIVVVNFFRMQTVAPKDVSIRLWSLVPLF